MDMPLVNTGSSASLAPVARGAIKTAAPVRQTASPAIETPAATTTTEVSSTVPVDPAQRLQQAVDSVNKFVKTANNNVEFSIDDDSGRVIVKLIDTQTREILKQFPSEDVLQMSKALGETLKKLNDLKGLIVEDKA